jgi:hypothetical protein
MIQKGTLDKTSLLQQPAIPFHSKEIRGMNSSKSGDASDGGEGETVKICLEHYGKGPRHELVQEWRRLGWWRG